MILIPIIKDYLIKQTLGKIEVPGSKRENKAIEILLEVHKITECLDQINFTIEMLSGFRKKKNSIMNRHDYIVFMSENFYLRISSIFDRVLRFANLVFEIGLPERECRESTIIKNQKIQGTKVETVLKNINKFIEEYKPIRNKVAHAESFSDPKLISVNAFHCVNDWDDSSELEKYRNYIKVRTDNYVTQRKEELSKSAEQIKGLVAELFDAMTPIIILNLKQYE